MAMILISHDLGVIAAERAAHDGDVWRHVVESGATARVFARPRPSLHARACSRARPRLGAPQGHAAGDHPRHRAGARGPAARLPLRRPLRLSPIAALPRDVPPPVDRQRRATRALPADRCPMAEPGRQPSPHEHDGSSTPCAPSRRCSRSTTSCSDYTLPRENLFRPAGEVHALNGVSLHARGRATASASSANPAPANRRWRALVMALETPTSGSRAPARARPASRCRAANCAARGAISRWCSRIPTARSIRARPSRASSPSR